MKRNGVGMLYVFLMIGGLIMAQASSPYTIATSDEYTSPKGYLFFDCRGFGEQGIIQIDERGMSSFSFQKFSNDLKLGKSVIIDTEKRFDKPSKIFSFEQTKNRSYFFASDDELSVKALEFFPEQLELSPESIFLFKSSGKVREGYGYATSSDLSSQLFYYSLLPKVRRDILSREVIGFQVFDEKLNKLWGGEFEMPYSEARMQVLDYVLANDGKVYIAARVIKKENQKAQTSEGDADYQYEIFAFQKDSPAPTSIVINITDRHPTAVNLFEDVNHHILITGFYTEGNNTSVRGAYVVRLDVSGANISKLNGGFYDIPADVVKQYTSTSEKKRLGKREKAGKDLGLFHLKIQEIYMMEDASIKIIAEEYEVVATDNMNVYGRRNYINYDTYANDIYVLSIGEKGKLEWVRKIPKAQRSNDQAGDELSFNSICVGNDLHIFYRDELENDKILETLESPMLYDAHKGGALIAVHLNPSGDIKRYNLGDIKIFKTDFFIRHFANGGDNNLITTERKGKKSILFSLKINSL